MLLVKKHKLINIVFSLVFVASVLALILPAQASALTVDELCRSQTSNNTDLYNCVLNTNNQVDSKCPPGVTAPAAYDTCVQNFLASQPGSANAKPISFGASPGKNPCGGGSGNKTIYTIIDFGCRGKGNPIIDILFGIIRFLSIGVGVVVVFSIVLAGIQFTSSQGDPAATAKALGRIRNTVMALVLYIFMYAILNWLIPAGIFR